MGHQSLMVLARTRISAKLLIVPPITRQEIGFCNLLPPSISEPISTD